MAEFWRLALTPSYCCRMSDRVDYLWGHSNRDNGKMAAKTVTDKEKVLSSGDQDDGYGNDDDVEDDKEEDDEEDYNDDDSQKEKRRNTKTTTLIFVAVLMILLLIFMLMTPMMAIIMSGKMPTAASANVHADDSEDGDYYELKDADNEEKDGDE
ncbi:unnamed protein product [Dibothriocephalus latus]|uniref:Uncharacterized protein n=1 Tax=Dibothriocephalus latus TaxID=60516 RepID=A0A3P7NZA3_DIBLA|nr:unnamed protein product [Dibothriocephalus latus]